MAKVSNDSFLWIKITSKDFNQFFFALICKFLNRATKLFSYAKQPKKIK